MAKENLKVKGTIHLKFKRAAASEGKHRAEVRKADAGTTVILAVL